MPSLMLLYTDLSCSYSFSTPRNVFHSRRSSSTHGSLSTASQASVPPTESLRRASRGVAKTCSSLLLHLARRSGHFWRWSVHDLKAYLDQAAFAICPEVMRAFDCLGIMVDYASNARMDVLPEPVPHDQCLSNSQDRAKATRS